MELTFLLQVQLFETETVFSKVSVVNIIYIFLLVSDFCPIIKRYTQFLRNIRNFLIFCLSLTNNTFVNAILDLGDTCLDLLSIFLTLFHRLTPTAKPLAHA